MHYRTPGTQRTASTILTCILALLAAILPSTASALLQTPADEPPIAVPPDAYTLHVYTNRMEIPTLVLSPQLAAVPRIASDQFEISLDGGPLFHPTHLQIEGNQPLSLAILLDFSGDARNLEPALIRTLPSFAAQSLRTYDHLDIYATDGSCIRSAANLPPTDAARIASALDRILHPAHRNGAAEKQLQCRKPTKLWNALAVVAENISIESGHRVVLLISDGQDHNSTIHWQALREFCASSSIAVFGLSPAGRRMQDTGVWMRLQNDPFNSLSQLTGGLVLYAYPMIVQQQLSHFIELVRSRYILEFPSPDHSAPGIHSITVTVSNTDDFVRPAGISFAPPDPALLSAPTTVPSAPSPAIMGDRPDPNLPH